jgi:hypothetical protein
MRKIPLIRRISDDAHQFSETLNDVETVTARVVRFRVQSLQVASCKNEIARLQGIMESLIVKNIDHYLIALIFFPPERPHQQIINHRCSDQRQQHRNTQRADHSDG